MIIMPSGLIVSSPSTGASCPVAIFSNVVTVDQIVSSLISNVFISNGIFESFFNSQIA